MLGVLIEIMFNVLLFASKPRKKPVTVIVISGIILGLAIVTVIRNISI